MSGPDSRSRLVVRLGSIAQSLSGVAFEPDSDESLVMDTAAVLKTPARGAGRLILTTRRLIHRPWKPTPWRSPFRQQSRFSDTEVPLEEIESLHLAEPRRGPLRNRSLTVQVRGGIVVIESRRARELHTHLSNALGYRVPG